MKLGQLPQAVLKPYASQIIRLIWLAFALLVLGLLWPAFSRQAMLLAIPCDHLNCFATQLTPWAAQAWTAAGETQADYALLQIASALITGGLALGAAGLLIAFKVHERLAVLAAFLATALAAGNVGQLLALDEAHAGLPLRLVSYVQIAGLFPVLSLCPTGVFAPRWLRWVALAYGGACLLVFWPGLALAPPLAALGLIGGAAALAYRLRRFTSGEQREQLLWACVGVGLAVLAVLLNTPLRFLPLDRLPPGLAWPSLYKLVLVARQFVAVGSFTCLLVFFFNYDTAPVGLHINRPLVYGSLTAFIVGAYAMSVAGVGALLWTQSNIGLSFIATILAAVAFNPFRERLQLAANRLLFGERDEPYRVLARLGSILEVAKQPAAALPVTVELIARALKLPYVAVALPTEGGRQIVAAYGAAPAAPPAAFPLVYGGESIGELLAGLRALNEPFGEADTQLLNAVARLVGPAAQAAQLTVDLERTRLRIVAAREEARRRLGSDLHDGVGHQLTGLTRQVERALQHLDHDPAAARAILREVTGQLQAALQQVRSLAHQLHPPELELLGLTQALRERTQTGMRVAIRLEAPETLPPLPAAVETAAYYIALEALTNVERHAEATTCRVRLALAGKTLELDIADDGRGLRSAQANGLGLLSMQARAAEVGGTCRVGVTPQGGTLISVRLPCGAALE